MEENPKKIWEVFYERYSKSFWFYIHKICGDENTADDIFQESFHRLLRAKPVLLDEHHMKSYLYKTASRLIIDKKRRKKVEKRAFEEKKQEFMVRMYKKDQETKIHSSLDMENTFRLLKPKERMLLWLAYAEGYSHNEIAELIEIKKTSIKVQLFRARKELVSILKQKEYKEGVEP